MSKSNKKVDSDALKADLLAYQGKYQQAASIFIKSNHTNQAINMFCELKRFDEAQRFLKMSNNTLQTKNILSNLVAEQAGWALANGDWKQAGQLYTSSKNYKTAIDIYIKENYLQGLIEVCRIIDKDGNQELLKNCANLFKKQKQHGYAKQIYLKMGDMKSLMLLHIQMQKWQEAFLLGKQNRQLLELAKLPYANYLLKNDKYEDAIRAFKKMNRLDLTSNLLKSLSTNAINQRRFIDAARQYWSMAIEELKSAKDVRSQSQETTMHLKKFQQLKSISQIYYIYNFIAEFVQTPFFTSSDAALYSILNGCRFLITQLGKYKLPYINTSYIYYSLAKVATKFEGYKTARTCYDKLSHLIVNSKWSQQMELGSLSVRSKPFSDKDTILPACPRCSMANPIISDKNGCFNCKHPFIISFMSFQVLPLIQFVPANGISHHRVVDLLNTEKKSKGRSDGWNQSVGKNQQILSYKQEVTLTITNPILKKKINETLENHQQLQVQYIPVVLEQSQIAEIQTESVYFLDLRKINPTMNVRYFINLASDILLKSCNQCGKFFLLDEYEFQFIQNKRCPFCNGEQKRSGRTKDIFDL